MDSCIISIQRLIPDSQELWKLISKFRNSKYSSRLNSYFFKSKELYKRIFITHEQCKVFGKWETCNIIVSLPLCIFDFRVLERTSLTTLLCDICDKLSLPREQTKFDVVELSKTLVLKILGVLLFIFYLLIAYWKCLPFEHLFCVVLTSLLFSDLGLVLADCSRSIT